ncbi:MAG TPA: NUDIX hydrolase [Candidatus Gallibacteroides avistercoris]|uniref:NUDIX hydrolase n=1 Tax=Candidatus Gallibacteroides avistercoris TaxID=2840833 RepID=A0A9D1SC94_9BACT|nr:NUDIX hydrolase [Candidatus Gallibacteroides avistercoris]
MRQINSSISVDCVIFGFDGTSLNVLLIKREQKNGIEEKEDYKLPGSMIYEDETLSQAAYRVLAQTTGLENIYLKQLHVFSDPERVRGEDLAWLNRFYQINTPRVVTVAYYSLVKLNDRILTYTMRKKAKWVDVQSIRSLGLDHKEIVMCALETLSRELMQLHIAFELLPRKITIRQLQNLYEAVLGVEIDNRNFRKKILSSGYLIPTNEKEQGVAHKPAQYYIFNKTQYEREQKSKFRLNFIN